METDKDTFHCAKADKIGKDMFGVSETLYLLLIYQ